MAPSPECGPVEQPATEDGAPIQYIRAWDARETKADWIGGNDGGGEPSSGEMRLGKLCSSTSSLAGIVYLAHCAHVD